MGEPKGGSGSGAGAVHTPAALGERGSPGERSPFSHPECRTGEDIPQAGPPQAPWWTVADRHQRSVRTVVDALVVVGSILFVLLQLGPSNLLMDTTPAGGDMGAHVWGPAYLRDHLLPNLQIAGWTPDWYAGFPAYQFYMVVPSLLIVVLDVGLVDPSGMPPLAWVVLGAGWLGLLTGLWPERRWRYAILALPLAALVILALPYGVAF